MFKLERIKNEKNQFIEKTLKKKKKTENFTQPITFHWLEKNEKKNGVFSQGQIKRFYQTTLSLSSLTTSQTKPSPCLNKPPCCPNQLPECYLKKHS